jgi:hypothetical protein
MEVQTSGIVGELNRRKKSKTTAVLLAIFLGFWTWLYLYKKSSFKFWLNLGLTIITACAWGVVAWIWAIIDTARKPLKWYDSYYDSIGTDVTPLPEQVKTPAVVPLSKVLTEPISKSAPLPSPLLVSACQMKKLYGSTTEHGLLAIGSKGITYLPLAKSEANKILVPVDIALTLVYIIIVTITRYDIWFFMLPLWLIMWLCNYLFSLAMKKRALLQEEVAKSKGLDYVIPTDIGFVFDWNVVDEVSVKHRFNSVVVAIKLFNKNKFFFLLMGKDNIINIASKAEAAAAVRNAVNRDAPEKLKP